MSTAVSWKKSSLLLVAPIVLIIVYLIFSGLEMDSFDIETATRRALNNVGIDIGKDWKSLNFKQDVDEERWSKVNKDIVSIEEKSIPIKV